MISLICMSTHKAMAARCLSYNQATYGQPAIRALATAPLRRLTLSVLFTIATNSYQTTCTVSERTFNKRQHANARHGVDFSLFTHYDNYYHMAQSLLNHIILDTKMCKSRFGDLHKTEQYKCQNVPAMLHWSKLDCT